MSQGWPHSDFPDHDLRCSWYGALVQYECRRCKALISYRHDDGEGPLDPVPPCKETE